MAKETTTLDPLFLGTDHEYIFDIRDEAEAVSLDINTWDLSWMLKRKLPDEDANALLTKTIGSGITVAGTFNADPASNAQRATTVIVDTDTDTLRPATCHWELKRTDAGFETVLAYGTVELKRGVHRA
jgi:hypothetical protein